jgi:thymidylate synthase
MSIKTQYDKPEDPPSKDVSIVMVIEEPFAEPRIHKSFPGGLENLEIYRQEVVEGVHDYWIHPEDGKWTYTYHKRLFGYKPAMRGENNNVVQMSAKIDKYYADGSLQMSGNVYPTFNQIQFIIDSLCNAPFSRRSQGITYMPSYDQGTSEPPCLQRVWCRMPEIDGMLTLNMNTHWRSRDAFKAAFMNIFALTDLQRCIAGEIAQKLKRPVAIGRYVDVCDSYHIYGSYFGEFKNFLETVKNRTFESRVWDSNDEIVQGCFEDGRGILKRERETGKIGMAR